MRYYVSENKSIIFVECLFTFDEKNCLHCDTCVRSCPTMTVKKIDGKIFVDHRKCSGAGVCSERGICIEKCPAHALKPEGERKTVTEIMEVVLQDLPHLLFFVVS